MVKKNLVFSVEASKKTSKEFLKNFKLNNFQNIKFKNNAISSIDNNNISFNESENDWESSQTHSKFDNYTVTKISTLKIDTLVKNVYLGDYLTMLKLDIEGNEINALKGAAEFILNTPVGSQPIKLGLLGNHNVLNAVASSAAAMEAGASLMHVKTGLESVKPVCGRLSLARGIKQCKVLDDT